MAYKRTLIGLLRPTICTYLSSFGLVLLSRSLLCSHVGPARVVPWPHSFNRVLFSCCQDSNNSISRLSVQNVQFQKATVSRALLQHWHCFLVEHRWSKKSRISKKSYKINSVAYWSWPLARCRLFYHICSVLNVKSDMFFEETSFLMETSFIVWCRNEPKKWI